MPWLAKTAAPDRIQQVVANPSDLRHFQHVVDAHDMRPAKTSIVVPGAFTGGTNHFAHSGRPADTQRVAEYENGPYKSFADDVMKGFASIVPPDADVAAVGEAIVKIVDAPFGKRPFRVHVDPTQDGAEVVNMVSDRVRAELLRRIGLTDVLTPRQLV